MTHHILLVEDNPADIDLLRIAFDELGLPVRFTVFHDGDAAIAGWQRTLADPDGAPRLALLDLNLPRTSGHAVLAAMRGIPAGRALPVLVLSTSNHPLDRARALSAGAQDYLVKPARFEELLDLVRDLDARFLSAP